MNRLTLLLLCIVPAALACDVFEAQLYMDRDAAPADSGASDSAPVDSGEVDSGAVALSDTCRGGPPLLTSSTGEFSVDTAGFSNNISDVASCSGTAAPGNDGFFSLDMTAGDTWHFHITALDPGLDPVVYVLASGCDARTCQRGDATNNCNKENEHFTYVAPADGVYVVAVDDVNGSGGSYLVNPVFPVCGNGTLEHSETCDDPAAADCTERCTSIVTSAGGEVEPNDDAAGANVLDFTTGRVRGDVADQCDLASFRFTAPAGATLNAVVYSRGTTACNSAAPALDLELLSTNGRTLFGSVTSAPGECPQILGTEPFAMGLDGDYVLRIRPTGDDERMYDFDLEVTVAVP
ncbi:MAG: hypothetical protein JRH11_10135 [Deltaproteobacteria bacterium]|nr:hypothetical protein [Deltaproteobacteria bacterium]